MPTPPDCDCTRHDPEDALPSGGLMVWLWRIDTAISRAWTRVINTVRGNG